MKIAIATVQVPFISGGAEILVSMLEKELLDRGHNVDVITIPFKWYPTTTLVNSMLMGRMIDLDEVNGEKIDLVIATKFPAFYIKHNNKVLWLMHQHRQAYDLWGTKYGDLHLLKEGDKIRDFIIANDNRYIKESKKIYTISKNTSNRLLQYNKINSTALYHPPKNYEKLICENYGDFIFYPSRIDSIKRQRLLVEAAKYLKSNVKIVIAGSGSLEEINYLKDYIKNNALEQKVKMVGFITEQEKINYYANCLAVYFGAYNEDYGYVTLEGFYSHKLVIVHKDAGGPLEFVEDNFNGFVLENNAKELAAKIDYIYEHKDEAKKLGDNGYRTLIEKNVSWDYVIEQLLK